MTSEEKSNLFKVLVSDSSVADDTVTAFLSMAKEKILTKAYPYGVPEGVTDVPPQYEHLQCEIAAYLWSKQGVLGQTAHNENGVARTYESASVPSSMLSAVVSHCKVV